MVPAQALLTVGLLAALAVHVDLRSLASRFGALAWLPVAFALCLGLADRLAAAWKWQLLLRAKDIRPGLGALFRAQMIGNFFGNFLPTGVGVDAIRIYIIARRTRRIVECVVASVVDRAVMVFATVLLAAGVATFTERSVLPGPWRWAAGVAGAAMLAGAVLATSDRLMGRALSVFSGGVGARVGATLDRCRLSLREYRRHGRTLIAAIAVAGVSMLARILFVQAEAAALDVTISFTSLLVTLPLAWLAVMLPISIGGLGLQEGVYVVVLGAVGVGPAEALAVSLLEQVLVRVVTLPGAIMWLSSRGQRAAAETRPDFAASESAAVGETPA